MGVDLIKSFGNTDFKKYASHSVLMLLMVLGILTGIVSIALGATQIAGLAAGVC